MNEDRFYVVVPRTVDSDKPPFKLSMTCGRMAAHVGHAAGKLQRAHPIKVEDENLIVLSVGSSAELLQLCMDLDRERIAFVRYYDEDKAFEGSLLTAIATVPIGKMQSEALKKLRPWKCKCNETDDMAHRSSVVEQSISNREVAGVQSAEVGSIPAGGSSSGS